MELKQKSQFLLKNPTSLFASLVLIAGSVTLMGAGGCGDIASSDTSQINSPNSTDNSTDNSNSVIGDSRCIDVCTQLPDGGGFTVGQECSGALQGHVTFSETFPENCTKLIEATRDADQDGIPDSEDDTPGVIINPAVS